MPDNTPRDRRDFRITDQDNLRRLAGLIPTRSRSVARRPDAPRGVRFSRGTVYWDPPQNSGNVTHYNIYVDDENNQKARVPAGQTSITGVGGARVFVSAFNNLNQLESRKVVLNAAVWPEQPRVGGMKTHREIQAAIDALPVEGGEVYLAAGEWEIGEAVSIPADKPNVELIGSGAGTILYRRQDMATGLGVINVYGSNAVIRNLCIDGLVMTSVGITYTAVFDAGGINGDPMHVTLSDQSSIRIHGGVSGVLIENCKITHTGGYAILIDAQTSDVSDILIRGNRFENNRPHLFGDTGDLVYGAWTGGILYRNNGVSPSTSKVRNLKVIGNSWYRSNGTCCWGHALGFDVLNEQFEAIDNTGLDLGLDFIMPGNTIGGTVANNTCRRVGYTHTTDVDTPAPKYYPNRYAVAYDTTGAVRGFSYVGNKAVSVNGGLIDLDGFHDGVVAGNTLIAAPDSGDAMYTEDQIGSYGTASSNITKGIQTGNTFYDEAAKGVSITGNLIRNCGTAAISLSAARRCLVKGNEIYHAVNPSSLGVFGVPVVIFSTSASNTEKQAKNNVITGNHIYWDIPALQINTVVKQSNYCIIESDDISNAIDAGATVPGPNFVYDNLIEGNNYGEWLKGPSSTGSAAKFSLPTNNTTATESSQTIIQREGYGATAATKIYSEEAGTTKQWVQVQESNAMMNVSDNGTALTGGVATGNRTTAAFGDVVFTGKAVADAFLALKGKDDAASTYDDTDADLLDDTWALFRFNETAGQIEASVSTSGGSRVWSALATGGAGSVAGADTQVQYNDGGAAFGADANFTWDKVNQLLTVTGTTGTAGIATAASFIQSAEGFYTDAVSQEAIKATGQSGVGGGGVAAREYAVYRADGGATGYDTVIDGSRNASFLAVDAGTVTSAGSGTVSAQNGFYTPSAAGNAIQAPSGGATCSTISGTSTAVNAVQASAGGVQAEKAIYLKTLASGPSSPNSGYGGLAHNSGATYFYWNGSSWATVNLSTAGGTPAGSDSYVQYNNSGSFGGDSRFTFNDGVSAQLAITTSSGVAGIVVSGGFMQSAQGFLTASTAFNSIQTSGGFLGATLQLTSTAVNSLTMAGGLDAAGDVDFGDELKRNSTVIINTSSQFIGSGGVDTAGAVDYGTSLKHNGSDIINSSDQFVGAGALCGASGIGAGAFNPWNGAGYDTGATGTIPVASTTSITVRGGVITGWS